MKTKTFRDRLYEKAAYQRIPIMGAFELLPACNLACKMCYVRKSMDYVNAHGGLLPTDRWLDLARQCRDLGAFTVLLTGGEPFLHPNLREIMAGIQDLGLEVSINSNATLIDRDTAQWLTHHPPVRINITLYGASDESYRRLCGRPAFSQVCQAVEALKDNGIRVKFNASITPDNVGDLGQMIRYAKSVGSPIQIATYMFPPVRRDAAMVGKNFRLTPEEAGKARVLADFYQNEPDWFRGQARRFATFVPLDRLPPAPAEPAEMGMRCRAGLCSFWVDWQGNLMNCGMYASAKLPLGDTTMAEAWPRLVEDTAQVRYAPYCAVCPNQHLCHACIAMVANECGQLTGRPEYLCQMNQAAAGYYQEYLHRLPENGHAPAEPDDFGHLDPAEPCGP